MRRTISALIVAAGLAGFGLSAQAAPALMSNGLGTSMGDVQTVRMDRMERRMMRRRMERRMERRAERRMNRRAVRRSMMRREMRGM